MKFYSPCLVHYNEIFKTITLVYCCCGCNTHFEVKLVTDAYDFNFVSFLFIFRFILSLMASFLASNSSVCCVCLGLIRTELK